MSKIKNMDVGDWIYLVVTAGVAGAGILLAANGWAELQTPAQIGGAIVAMGTVVANYFKSSPQ